MGRILITMYFFNEAFTVIQTSPYLASLLWDHLSDGVWQVRCLSHEKASRQESGVVQNIVLLIECEEGCLPSTLAIIHSMLAANKLF